MLLTEQERKLSAKKRKTSANTSELDSQRPNICPVIDVGSKINDITGLLAVVTHLLHGQSLARFIRIRKFLRVFNRSDKALRFLVSYKVVLIEFFGGVSGPTVGA